ncbi:MAG TPA: response regulator [Bryobacteraceae bacterium]|nr:response regulator [Bryobacteraceae bacterium]
MKSVRIFLAEDNAADVWLIEEAIRRQNIPFKIDNYATAADAIDAVRKCGQGESPVPDLILLDYNLPAGHGAEILEAAAQNPRVACVPKAILTSFLPPGESKKALELGARRVIAKPASLDEFMSEVGGNVAELLQTGPAPHSKR